MRLSLSVFGAALLLLALHAGGEQAAAPAPPPANIALRAIFGLSIRLQAVLDADSAGNFIVSPISAAIVAGQLMLGSTGEFRNYLAEALSIDDVDNYQMDRLEEKGVRVGLPFARFHVELLALLNALKRSQNKRQEFTLEQKSALFYDKNVTLKYAFQKYMEFFYATEQVALDFYGSPKETQAFVNNWAKKNTNGLIKTILDKPPGADTASIFANAIYFLAEWEDPFSDELNRKGEFSVTINKTVPVTYMVNSFEDIKYVEHDLYHMIALPYKNEELEMYIMLPKKSTKYEYDIKGFVSYLEPSDITRTILRAKKRGVVVMLPKMELSHSFSVLDQLKKYYVFKKTAAINKVNQVDDIKKNVDLYKNFTVNVNELNKNFYLTNASAIGNLRIDDIVQQVVLSINEKGTEAGVVTSSTVDYIGGQKNFLLNRPFCFFINHAETNATLFWGTIVNPIA